MPVRAATMIAALAAATDDEAFAVALRQAAGALLAAPAGLGEVAAVAVDPCDGPKGGAAAALLSAALDEARMAAENGLAEGRALIAAAGDAIAALDAAGRLDPAARLRLAQVYTRAGLAPPPAAQLTPETLAATGFDADPLRGPVPDVGPMIADALEAAEGDLLQGFLRLSEMLAAAPEGPRAMIAGLVAARPGAAEARFGLYWLLDAAPAVRTAAAASLARRAAAGALDAEAARMLPVLRKWMPADAARAGVDAAVREALRAGAAPAAPQPWIVHRALACLPDGAGAQSLAAAVQQGGRRGVAMILLKQGHGVKDAFVIPCASASEQKRLLARVAAETDPHDVAPGFIAEAVARALGEGAALGLLPAPGLVDMAGIFGAEALGPAPGDAAAILAAIGADAALAAAPPAEIARLVPDSGGWRERHGGVDSWFEDTSELRAALGRARTPAGVEKAAWRHLETRRAWWARQCAVAAATLKAAQGGNGADWLSFAAVAEALRGGRPLRSIPAMEAVVATTLAAFGARRAPPVPAAAPRAPRRTAPAARARGLIRAGLVPARVDGYLTALAVSPRAPAPEAWLGGLLGEAEVSGRAALDRLLDLIMERANAIDDLAADPQAVAAMIGALDAEGFRAWCAGFGALVAATKRCWPARALAADDRRVLADLAAVAAGADPGPLRAALPAWIARRMALRG